MYQIIEKEMLAPNLMHMRFMAPKVAMSALPGQFIIIRVDEAGERIPMGLSGWDEKEGTVDIVFYTIGTSTMKLAALNEGDGVMNLAGPLGKPTEMGSFGRVICACGCFGVGQMLPIVKALKEIGNEVITVIEARGREFIFWEDRLREFSDELHIVLGDGGCGKSTWANDFISEQLSAGRKVDRIFIHGCPFMMMESSNASRPFGIKTLVSLVPIMVDGTGMCGACRVEVDNETKFACVDGPDFDGHKVNWEGLTLRLRQFIPEEDRSHNLWERANWHRMIASKQSASRQRINDQILAQIVVNQDLPEQEHSGGCCYEAETDS